VGDAELTVTLCDALFGQVLLVMLAIGLDRPLTIEVLNLIRLFGQYPIPHLKDRERTRRRPHAIAV